MKKAVGYIRTGGGAKDEARQRSFIDAFAMEQNVAITEWVKAADFSEMAYGDWKGRRKIDGVIAATCRDVSGNIYEFYAYKCKMRLMSSDLWVANDEGFTGYELYRKMLDEFTDEFCRMEIEHEPVKHSTGRMRKASKGAYIGGRAPMGYKVEDGGLVINPEEVPVVLCVMDRKHEGRTMLSTVDALNQGGYKTRNGRPFVISTVQGIWNNEMFYRGYYRYGKDGEWVKGQHEAILKD